DRMADRIVTRYFAHKSYWKPGGRPYFSIYELYRFIDSMGGLDNARKILDHLRAVSGGIHLNAVLWGVRPINNTFQSLDSNQVLKALGVDSVTSYVWLHHAQLKDFPSTPYSTLARDSVAFWSKAARDYAVPFHPNVTMGWDSTPRTCQSDIFENRGYPFTPVVTGNTPQAFRAALEQARAFLDSRPGPRILNINAWNEWTEGSYLEPDTLNGLAYLQAVRDTFPPPR
ncbi:MAG: glycoside hydrolase family 99-like domain-containing protein, partial [Fimbriimonas ginsengisoli]|nr:glycoside hydrolase family 99-like domain-containing protein [Fimbriimonas ginsengisoli]